MASGRAWSEVGDVLYSMCFHCATLSIAFLIQLLHWRSSEACVQVWVQVFGQPTAMICSLRSTQWSAACVVVVWCGVVCS